MTVDELERKSVESLIRSLCLNGERGGKTPAEMRYLIREWAQSHSRQLWLEAAEIAESGDEDGCGMAIGRALRLKAEAEK